MEFDYVIAGGGSAGATLAARLSDNPDLSICLIEAGGEGKDILIRAPMGVVAMLPGRPKINNWAFETEPQPGLNGRRGFQPRGKALGGSSAINAMLYVRGHRSDYDGWASVGCTGWSFDALLPYFKRSEGNERGGDEWHGGEGPLRVANQRTPHPANEAFIAACGEMQIPANADFNGPEQEGAGLYQVTQFFDQRRGGERCSAAAAYLHPVMNRPNLTVITKAQATAIAFDGLRATGLRYRRGGEERVAHARREVIVSGGAFGSPQLLMLSGIGPAGELKRHGITVVKDMPGVGQNLQDHLDYVQAWRSNDTNFLGIGPTGTANIVKSILQWRKTGTGMIASPGAEGGAFIKSNPALDRPDLQLHFVAGIVDDHARKLHWGHGFSCHVCVLRPFSRGEVGLKSADPLAAPRIDPRYLADARDAELMVKGVRIMRTILSGSALAPYRTTELYPFANDSDDEILSHIRARADTIYHPVGTCRMGVDEGAVVDPELRVRGLEGLRVVDASVMPTLIGGNTNAPTIVIAEKAADMILKGVP